MMPFVVEEWHGITVVRDDLVPGGTKARVLPALLEPGTEYVYAGPVYGYAQVALAYACAAVGASATVFVAARKTRHTRTADAIRAGAKVVEVGTGYLSNVRAKARAYAEMTGAHMFPLGFDTPDFRDRMASVARSSGLAFDGRRIWTVAGSGTLSRALQDAWPNSEFVAVRISEMVPDVGRAETVVAPERFDADAKVPPPFPSTSNYDAKAWRFLRDAGRPGDVFWNVAC